MLVEITEESHNVIVSLEYATHRNFTGRPVYRKNARCFLRPEAAECLVKAVTMARAIGYGIKVFDAFRPSEAQWKLWDHTPDPDFLADPRRGSPHSRGVAVDLTLTDSMTGKELDMGTAFDEFTPLSHHANTEINTAAQRNRIIMLGIMTAAGWDFYRNEWWHYQLFHSRNFPLLNDGEAGTEMMEP